MCLDAIDLLKSAHVHEPQLAPRWTCLGPYEPESGKRPLEILNFLAWTLPLRQNGSPNLVWHWNGKRRLNLEFRFRWRMHTNLINQTKHRQPYLFKFTWEKKKQTKHSNTTQTNIAVYSCPPALNTFVTLHALSGSSVHANVCPWVPHSARFARLARRSAFEGWAILFKLLIRF